MKINQKKKHDENPTEKCTKVFVQPMTWCARMILQFFRASRRKQSVESIEKFKGDYGIVIVDKKTKNESQLLLSTKNMKEFVWDVFICEWNNVFRLFLLLLHLLQKRTAKISRNNKVNGFNLIIHICIEIYCNLMRYYFRQRWWQLTRYPKGATDRWSFFCWVPSYDIC